MSTYSSKEITEFAKAANSDLGSGKYKPEDLKIDYCKAINIIMQLQSNIVNTPEQIKVPDTETITEYTRFVMSCASAGNKSTALQIEQGCIGISTEAGELLDNLKKSLFQERDFDKVNAIEECGDILFYMSELLEALDSNIFEAIEANIRKLKERYKGERFDKDLSLNRDTDVEREVMENTEHPLRKHFSTQESSTLVDTPEKEPKEVCDKGCDVCNPACDGYKEPKVVEVKKTCNTCKKLYALGGCRIKQAGVPGDYCDNHEPSTPSTKK